MTKALANKILVIILHGCGWALLFTVPFHFLSRGHGPGERGLEKLSAPDVAFSPPVPFDPTMIRLESLISNGLLFIFFYLNMLVLVPNILTKKRLGALCIVNRFVPFNLPDIFLFPQTKFCPFRNIQPTAVYRGAKLLYGVWIESRSAAHAGSLSV